MDPLASINPYVSLKDGSQLGQVYQKLPERSTRFLRYKGIEQPPESLHGFLVFEFEVHDVADKTQYSALSYTWGHPVLDDFKDDLSHAVICNGQRMPIGLNLHDALQHVYVESDIAPPLFWVDALCINQGDLEERAKQVSLMTSIYSNAANVVVWLGKDDEDAHEAHSLLSEYSPALTQIVSDLISENPMGAIEAGMINLYDDAKMHEKYHLTPRSMDAWKAVVRFLSRRWFSRIWIVQEMVFNRSHLMCSGPLRFDWSDLDRFVSLVFGAQWHGLNFRGVERETSRISRAFTFHREIRLSATDYVNDDPHFSLLSAEGKLYDFAQSYLLSSAFLDATDPRDRVFALSAFVNAYAAKLEIKPIWLRADYTLQTTEVMLRTAQVLLWKTRSLDMLSYVPDLSYRADSNLPSWMPHFHIPGAVASVESLLDMHQGRKCHAGSLSTAVQTFSDVYLHMDSPGQELETQGYLLDTVEQVVLFDSGFISTMEICLSLPPRYVNGESPVEALWRTLIAGRTDTAFPAPPETANDFALFVRAGLIGISLEALEAGNRDALLRLITVLGEIETRCPHVSIPTVEEFNGILSSVLGDLDGCLKMLTELHASSTYRTMMSPTHWGQKGKALFRTRKGFLGLSPYSTQIGDEVWLLKGARLFHVLRKPESSSDERILLGEGYVHGFMEGEVLRLDGMSYTPVIIR
ncbi:HET-domain-containing protein [Hypoxylon cercidicola]|nr:HET-domain-containing protein [Hypoxylon cercidicola]